MNLPPVHLLLLAAALAAGCPSASKTPAASAPASDAGSAQAAEADSTAAEAPEGSRFVCHLNCSGQEKSAYGVTEEEAYTNARGLVEGMCRPEDGQHFIVCEAVE